MPVTFSEKFIAYLALFSGLALSLVAEYYSILGLTAIFSTAVVAVVIMGIVLGVGKITATLWLKQNWSIAPWTVKLYLLVAILVLMLITSMGIFGFLSKAHSDQSLVSGDVLAKLAIYDEKIKTAKENVEIKRKELKQLDEAVDQVMARSQDEKGADKAIAIRKSQQRDRTRLSKEIEAEQIRISELNNEAAPIRAQVRQVEAEVGPIKYIAAFVYGETDQSILEKSVTWVIIILIFVFDPLAVILLLASQISFQNFRDRRVEEHPPYYVADVGEKPTEEEKAEISTEGDGPEKESDVVSTATVTSISQELTDEDYKEIFSAKPYPSTDAELEEMLSSRPVEPAYLNQGFGKLRHPPGVEPVKPLVYREESETPLFVQNEEQTESDLWSATTVAITKEEYVNYSAEQVEAEVDVMAREIKAGRMAWTDVPESILLAVKAKV